VKFEVDNCISVVPISNIVGCETVEIGTNHLIQWEKEEHVYKAIILALGKYVCHCVKVSIDT